MNTLGRCCRYWTDLVTGDRPGDGGPSSTHALPLNTQGLGAVWPRAGLPPLLTPQPVQTSLTGHRPQPSPLHPPQAARVIRVALEGNVGCRARRGSLESRGPPGRERTQISHTALPSAELRV